MTFAPNRVRPTAVHGSSPRFPQPSFKFPSQVSANLPADASGTFLMLITDAVRESASRQEIHFLLTAYVEAIRHRNPLDRLPGFLVELPVAGIADVRARARRTQLFLESSEGVDAGIRSALTEALGLFAAAGERLEALTGSGASVLLEAA